jgi:polyhydroxyalkanoate synthesis regulator phasin
MKRLMFVVMFAVMLFGTVAVGFAERGYGRGEIRSRIEDAKVRIDRGIERGSLTRHEARKLIDELDRILARIDRMKDDGHLSPRERERINHDLDRLDRHITREKRDLDRRRY